MTTFLSQTFTKTSLHIPMCTLLCTIF